MKNCPFCAEQIQDEAVKCRHCGEALDTAAAKWRIYRKKFEAMSPDERALEWKRLTPSQRQLLTKGGVTIPTAVAPPAKSSAAEGTPNKQTNASTKTLKYVGIGVAALFVLGLLAQLLSPEPPRRVAPQVKQAERDSPASSPRSSSPDSVESTTTKEFTFPVQGGQEITAYSKAAADASGKHNVVFSPFIEKTDGNLYNAALHSLWNIYGKQRGLFQLQDAQTRENASLGGNAICWRISNPDAEYCIFPTKDSESGRIGVLTVWVQ